MPPTRRRSPALAIMAALVVVLLAVGGVTIARNADTTAGRPVPAATTASSAGITSTGRGREPSESSRTSTATSSTAPPETCTRSGAIAELPLRRRLAQLLVVGVGASSTSRALSVTRSEQVGGLFLTGDATRLLTGDRLSRVRAAAEIPPLVAVDDEGGRVQRVAPLEGSMPSAREMAASMSPERLYELARERGSALARRGVTVNLAPVVDVSSQPATAVIGDRSFGADPDVVTRYAAAFARGMRSAGVLPVYKHFPGHGRATGDSHAGPVTTPPLSELATVDLRPYRELLGRGKAAVMLGHLDVPGLTEDGVPASVSPAAVGLLRDEYGFDGLVLTDDLYAMDAIRQRYGLAEATRRALAAGVDMALMVDAGSLGQVLDHLEEAVADGSLPRQRVNSAVGHVLRAKGVDPCAR